MTQSDPVARVAEGGSTDRIHVLDILRGLALLGMILVHFHQEIEVEVSGPEGLISWVIWLGVETKAWGIFALLFGVGFAVLLGRLEAKGIPVVGFYLRRLAGLALFGVVAEVYFGFEILLEYAIWGVPLLLIRRWPTGLLLLVALASAAGPSLIMLGRQMQESGATALAAPQIDERAQAHLVVIAAERGSSYPVLVRARAREMSVTYTSWSTYVPASTFALFVLGLLAMRQELFLQPLKHQTLILGWMAFGLLSWGAAWLLWFLAPPDLLGELTWLLYGGFGLVQDQWLCLTYVGAMVLLTARWPAVLQYLAPIGAAGRMALTNYMLQIAVLDFLASGYGLQLRARPLFSLVGTGLLFGSLVVISCWWLSRFRYGPAEWLWRSFTFVRWQPMRSARADGAGDLGQHR